MLATGDIVGFVTRRPNLDYFHIGFVAFGTGGELLLRHASESHGVACWTSAWSASSRINRVRYVTLLRPDEPAAGAVAARKTFDSVTPRGLALRLHFGGVVFHQRAW